MAKQTELQAFNKDIQTYYTLLTFILSVSSFALAFALPFYVS